MIEGNSKVTNCKPVRYELIGSDGRTHGRFWAAEAAANCARDMWPDQEQDEERAGKGWDIQVVEACR